MTSVLGLYAGLFPGLGMLAVRPFCGRKILCACVLLLALPLAAGAEIVHVSAASDAGLPVTQARQQALERALADAVFQESQRLLPTPAPTERTAALRAYLSPRSLDFVQSYQEAAPSKPAPDAAEQAPVPDKNVPLVLEIDVNVQRAALRQTLLRLGFLSGPRHPGAYVLRLGPGVKEKELQALAPSSLLLGLARTQQNPAAPEVTLERLPQGYCKAVLRQGSIVIAADAPDLPALWLDVWGRYFTDSRMQPGPGLQRLSVSGFRSVDAVQDFLRTLAGWDDAVQEPGLEGMDLNGDGVSARFSCRVINQERLDARLRETLPARKLILTAQAGAGKP